MPNNLPEDCLWLAAVCRSAPETPRSGCMLGLHIACTYSALCLASNHVPGWSHPATNMHSCAVLCIPQHPCAVLCSSTQPCAELCSSTQPYAVLCSSTHPSPAVWIIRLCSCSTAMEPSEPMSWPREAPAACMAERLCIAALSQHMDMSAWRGSALPHYRLHDPSIQHLLQAAHCVPHCSAEVLVPYESYEARAAPQHLLFYTYKPTVLVPSLLTTECYHPCILHCCLIIAPQVIPRILLRSTQHGAPG